MILKSSLQQWLASFRLLTFLNSITSFWQDCKELGLQQITLQQLSMALQIFQFSEQALARWKQKFALVGSSETAILQYSIAYSVLLDFQSSKARLKQLAGLLGLLLMILRQQSIAIWLDSQYIRPMLPATLICWAICIFIFVLQVLSQEFVCDFLTRTPGYDFIIFIFQNYYFYVVKSHKLSIQFNLDHFCFPFRTQENCNIISTFRSFAFRLIQSNKVFIFDASQLCLHNFQLKLHHLYNTEIESFLTHQFNSNFFILSNSSSS